MLVNFVYLCVSVCLRTPAQSTSAGKTILTGRARLCELLQLTGAATTLPFLIGHLYKAVGRPGLVEDTEVMGLAESFTGDLFPDKAVLCAFLLGTVAGREPQLHKTKRRNSSAWGGVQISLGPHSLGAKIPAPLAYATSPRVC